MKTISIIAEYNPFHNGHAWQIAEAKRRTGADFALIVMSGDFVRVRVTGALDYDLIGEVEDEFTE